MDGIKINIDAQIAKKINNFEIPSKTMEFIPISIEFNDDWNDAKKYIQYIRYSRTIEVEYKDSIQNYVPPDCIDSPGELQIAFRGLWYNGEEVSKIASTNPLSYKVIDSEWSDNPANAGDIKNTTILDELYGVVKSIRDDADSGKFNGEKGDKGDTPQKGVDYWTESDKKEIEDYVTGQVSPKINDIKNDIKKIDSDTQNKLALSYYARAIRSGAIPLSVKAYGFKNYTFDSGSSYLDVKIVDNNTGKQYFNQYTSDTNFIDSKYPECYGSVDISGNSNNAPGNFPNLNYSVYVKSNDSGNIMLFVKLNDYVGFNDIMTVPWCDNIYTTYLTNGEWVQAFNRNVLIDMSLGAYDDEDLIKASEITYRFEAVNYTNVIWQLNNNTSIELFRDDLYSAGYADSPMIVYSGTANSKFIFGYTMSFNDSTTTPISMSLKSGADDSIFNFVDASTNNIIYTWDVAEQGKTINIGSSEIESRAFSDIKVIQTK